MSSTYAGGMSLVILFVFTVFILICVLDIICVHRKWPSIGYRLQEWSRRNPLYAFLLLGVLGSLLTHFLANKLWPFSAG